MASTLESQVGNVKANIRYPNSKILMEISSSLSDILEEVNFEITKEALRIRGTDPAKIAYIEVFMPMESFLDYEVKEEINMGVNVASLENIISRSKRGDEVTFMVSDDKVLIKIEGEVNKKFLLPNIEVILDVPSEIKIDYDAKVQIIADSFKKALSDASIFSDNVEFVAEENKFIVRSEGEGPRGEAVFMMGSGSLIGIEVKQEARSKYDINYLNSVLNLAKIAETVEVAFSTEKPLQLLFSIPDNSRVRYLLAPTSGL
ncbi:MAG: DNA polymerase sliding clamp [Caldisphaeraceae archaeon]|nr:DNA polymerase sliding clamp [Caldisphaeraceae archaeon]